MFIVASIPIILWTPTKHSGKMQTLVRQTLENAIQAADEEHTAEDLLRCFAEEAMLMFRTDEIRRTLTTDPYQRLGCIPASVQRLGRLLRVTQYEKVLTGTGYCRTAATVELMADQKMRQVGVEKYVHLQFVYEREGTHGLGDKASVWYSIDVSRDDGPNEKILWIKVFGAGQVPSGLPAINLDEDEGDWEDVDDEEEEVVEEDDDSADKPVESKLKRARVGEKEIPNDMEHQAEVHDNNEQNDDDEQLADRYTAGMDPDALERFLHWCVLGKVDDATAFFLLMSFPFYEMEFDLVDWILDAVFGPEDEKDEGEEYDA